MSTAIKAETKTQEQRDEEFRTMHSRPVVMVNTSDASLRLIEDEKGARECWDRSERLRSEFTGVGAFISYWKALRTGGARTCGKSNR